jgi:hypothetical protein
MEGKMVGMENNMEGIKNNMDDMENKMEENKNDIKKEIQNSMKEMENMSSLISQAIDGIFPKGDINMEWNHENKVVLLLNKLPIISHVVNLTLIVELILVGCLNSTFPKLN